MRASAAWGARAVVGVALLAGCDARDEGYQHPVDFLEPAAVAGRLAYFETVRQSAYIVDPSSLAAGSGASVTTIRLEGEPRSFVTRAGSQGRQQLVLAGDDETSRLWVLGGPCEEASAESVELKRPFTAIGQAPAGDLLLLYFADASRDRGFSGRSAVQLVALNDAGAAPVDSRVVELQNLGSPPRFVAVSDPSDGAPRFAVVGFDGYLSLLSVLVDAGMGLAIEHFSVGLQQAGFRPDQVTFAGRWVIVREQDRSELLALRHDDEGFFVTRVDVGGTPLTIEGYLTGTCPGDATQPHVVALVEGEEGQTTVVDVDLELEQQASAALDFRADRLLRHGDGSCDAEQGLVAYAADGRDGLALINLRHFQSRGSANIERVLLSTRVAELHVVHAWPDALAGCEADAGQAAANGGGSEDDDALGPSLVLIYAEGGVGVLDLESGALRAAAAGIDASGAVLDTQSRSLWVSADEASQVDQVVLTDGTVRRFALHAPVEALLPLDGAFAVVHPSTWGHVTLIRSLDQAVRSRAGFLAEQLGADE